MTRRMASGSVSCGGGGRKPGSAGESRRLALLKRAGLFGNDTRGAVIDRAIDLDHLEAAYRLVHEVFVERGYIVRRPGGLRVRVHEMLPDTATFVAHVDDAIVGVQSLAVDSRDLGLPSDEAFRAEVNDLRSFGGLVCEATNEAFAPAYRRSAVPTELMRCCFAHALYIGCSRLITAVSPGHARFYGLLGFEPISPVRSYSSDVDDPVVLVSMDLGLLGERFGGVHEEQADDEAFIKKYYIDENPYHQSVKEWATSAAREFADPARRRELLRRTLLRDARVHR